MDTLDKILKTHKLPLHLHLKKGQFETVIVTEYPHGYDVSHRHICGNYHDAFRKAIDFPQVQDGQPYAWRIYGYGQVKIAQSPNLLQLLPDDGFAKLEKLLDEYRELETKNNDQYADALSENFKLRESLKKLRKAAIEFIQALNPANQMDPDDFGYKLNQTISAITVRHGKSMVLTDEELAPYRHVYGKIEGDSNE